MWGIGILVVVLYALIPVVWIASLSVKPPDKLSDGKFFSGSPTFENYKSIFNDDTFLAALVNSIGIASIATVISIVGSLFDMWRSIGLYDTWAGLIIPYMTFALPLAIYTLSAFFREIPWELEQAAQVDGATPWQAFSKVIAPLAAPGVFTTAILVFIFAWNDFVFAFSLTSTKAAQTVPAALSQFPGASQFQQPTGSIAAAAVVVTVPIIIMVLFFQRRIVAGLTAGAVKG